MSPSPIARRLLVRGHVQGVGYRATVAHEAQRAGVAGWAVNRDDGAVALHLEGARRAVERVEALCRRAVPGARVHSVDAETTDVEELSGFEVR